MKRSGGAWRWFVLLFGPPILAGCSQKEVKQQRDPTEERLYKIGNAYLQSITRLGRAPTNIEEMKPELGGAVSTDLLRSPNDGEEFVILWGVDYATLPSQGSDPYTVGAYEKTGVNGQRYVLRFPMGVLRMTDERLKKANFPRGYLAPD